MCWGCGKWRKKGQRCYCQYAALCVLLGLTTEEVRGL